ncbi:hypothetical protein MRX96_034706 [Rhipicephalus microplus]
MKFPWKRYHFIANATILKGALYASIPLNYSSYADKQGVLCSADVTTLSISTYFRSLSVVKPVEQKFLKQAKPLVSMQIQHELERSCKLSAARVKEIWQNHRGIISTEAPGITTSVKDPEDEDKVSPVDQASSHTPSTTAKQNAKHHIKSHVTHHIKLHAKHNQHVKHNAKHNVKHNVKPLVRHNSKSFIKHNVKHNVKRNVKPLVRHINKCLVKHNDKHHANHRERDNRHDSKY